MSDEVVKILKVEVGDSEQTVKGLKEEIKDLRDNILNLEEGTEEYSKAVAKLQDDQSKLDKVMSLTKKNVSSLGESYNSLGQQISEFDSGIMNNEQTVKGLKEEINSLKDNILNLEEGTEEYSKAVTKLQEDQRKLDKVMSLTKKTATALDGSYDALVQQMSLLKSEWRATNDEAKRNELGKQIATINDKLKDMDAEVGNFSRNVGNYTESIVDAFEEMNHSVDEWKNKAADAWETGDLKAYTEAIKEAGKAQAKVERIEQDLEANTPTLEKGFQGLTDTAAGLAGGFEAVQAIMVLTGRETGNFEKIMQKFQATMALVQGMQALGGLPRALKAVNVSIKTVSATIKTAMASNPVGWILAITGAIVGLTASFVSNARAAREAEAATKGIADQQARLRSELEMSSDEYGKQASLLAAKGMSEIEVQKEITQTAKNRFDEAKKQLTDIGTKIQGIMAEQPKYNNFRKKFIAESPDSLDTLIDKYRPGEVATYGYLNKTKDLYKKYEEARKLVTEAQSQYEERLKALATTKDLVKAKLGLADADYETALLGPIEVLKTKQEKELKLYEDAGMDTVTLLKRQHQEMKELLDQIEEERKKAEEERALRIPPSVESVTEGITKDAETMKIEDEPLPEDFYDTKLGDELDYAEKSWEISRELADIKTDYEVRKEQEAAEKIREIQQQKQDIFKESLGVISTVVGGLGALYQQDLDNQLAAEKITDEVYAEKFKKVKAFQIAEATINTIAGVVGAFMGITKDTGGWGIALAAIQAAAVAATGAMQIAQISKTEPGAAAVKSGMVAPPANIFGEDKPKETHILTGMKEAEELNRNQRVYLVESDIEESGKKAQVIDDETSF